MPVGEVRALNTVQRIPETPLNERSTLQPHTYYTCPAGKKAKFTGKVRCRTQGAAAHIHLRDPTDFINYLTWAPSPSVGEISLNTWVDVELDLDAGDVIKSTQDTGTNATFDVFGKILELPA